MQLLELKDDKKHCIRTKKVFDWVNRIVHIKEKEIIQFPRKKEEFKDCICCDFKIKCNSRFRTPLWTGYGIHHIAATVQIKLTSSCGCSLDIFVNGKKIDSISKGQSFCATLGDIKLIEVQCRNDECNQTDKKSCCCGEFLINIHSLNENKFDCDIKELRCFLSDKDGNEIDPYAPHSIECKELLKDFPRQDIKVTLPNGKKVNLQKVTILKSGFITVHFLNSKKIVCKECTFPFSEVETFLLCAPPGTEIKCDISDFECNVYQLPLPGKEKDCIKIQLSIQICQSIQVIGEVKVEIIGKICNPRVETDIISNCPSHDQPEQCPLIPT